MMGLQDGTAKFAVQDLRGRGLKIDTYPSHLQMVKDLCRLAMFDLANPYIKKNMEDEYWRSKLEGVKSQLLAELEVELQEAIDAEFSE